MLELLAPAGSMEALRAAVQNGADAVYLGCGAFNARQSAKNFTPQTLVEAIKYCHVRGVQVHLTLNTLVSDREMTEAAELGTKKVMEDHCSIGLVVTTDGTITEIPREDYVQAEKRAITDMQKTGKPFLVIVNSRNPAGEAAGAVKAYLQNTFALRRWTPRVSASS